MYMSGAGAGIAAMYRVKDTGGVVSSTATNEVWLDTTE
jgi:hypothetical protein